MRWYNGDYFIGRKYLQKKVFFRIWMESQKFIPQNVVILVNQKSFSCKIFIIIPAASYGDLLRLFQVFLPLKIFLTLEPQKFWTKNYFTGRKFRGEKVSWGKKNFRDLLSRMAKWILFAWRKLSRIEGFPNKILLIFTEN